MLGDYQLAYNGIKVALRRTSSPSSKGFRASPPSARSGLRSSPTSAACRFSARPCGTSPASTVSIKIAIIDTGIDYTHANFGGPGTIGAFDAADAADTVAPPAR